MDGRRQGGKSAQPRGSWQNGLPAGFVSRENMQARLKEKSTGGGRVKPPATQAQALDRGNENSANQGRQSQRPSVPKDSGKTPTKDNANIFTAQNKTGALTFTDKASTVTKVKIQDAALGTDTAGAAAGATNSLHIMIMNADGKGYVERRKQAIQTVITKTMPDIVLFQEFKWAGFRPSTWKDYPIPGHYDYKGHQDASMMYDENIIQAKYLPQSDIDSTLGALQNSPNNRLKQRFPLDFTPVPRMCITQVTSNKSSSINFILVSWHGRNNKSRQDGHGRLKDSDKREHFKYLMEFLRNLKENFKLPLLIGGDFNVDMRSIKDLVQYPFKLCLYDASMRRTDKGIIDFFIISEEMDASNITWFDLERNTEVFHPNEVLDHDPVSATIRCVPVSKGKSKFSNPNDWVSTRTRAKSEDLVPQLVTSRRQSSSI